MCSSAYVFCRDALTAVYQLSRLSENNCSKFLNSRAYDHNKRFELFLSSAQTLFQYLDTRTNLCIGVYRLRLKIDGRSTAHFPGPVFWRRRMPTTTTKPSFESDVFHSENLTQKIVHGDNIILCYKTRDGNIIIRDNQEDGIHVVTYNIRNIVLAHVGRGMNGRVRDGIIYNITHRRGASGIQRRWRRRRRQRRKYGRRPWATGGKRRGHRLL